MLSLPLCLVSSRCRIPLLTTSSILSLYSASFRFLLYLVNGSFKSSCFFLFVLNPPSSACVFLIAHVTSLLPLCPPNSPVSTLILLYYYFKRGSPNCILLMKKLYHNYFIVTWQWLSNLLKFFTPKIGISLTLALIRQLINVYHGSINSVCDSAVCTSSPCSKSM